MLPDLTPQGRLPVGRHATTMAELHQRFVLGAPHEEHRQLLFDALVVYARLVTRLLPEAKLWVDGGFVTHKPEPPKDVDVVIVSPPAQVRDEDLLPLLTVQDVIVGHPVLIGVDRLMPMAGLVDGFFAPAQDPSVLAYWDDLWSRVNNAPDTERKGYLEVRL